MYGVAIEVNAVLHGPLSFFTWSSRFLRNKCEGLTGVRTAEDAKVVRFALCSGPRYHPRVSCSLYFTPKTGMVLSNGQWTVTFSVFITEQ